MLFFSGRISDQICSFRLPKDGIKDGMLLGNCVREETVHISKSFAPYFMKCITIILTVQWSAG